MVIKYSGFLDRWDDDWQVAFKEMCEKTKTEGSTVVITVLEEQGVSSPNSHSRIIIILMYKH